MNDQSLESVERIEIKYRTYPTWIKFSVAAILYINAVYVLISAFRVGIVIFEESLALGLILFLTGIGFIILGAPVYIAFGAPTFLSETLDNQISNLWEFLGKSVLYFIIAFLLPYVIQFIVGLFLIAILDI